MKKTLTAEELKRVFVRDAKRSVEALEKIEPKIKTNNLGDSEWQSYVITAHGMKNALMLIGESELSKYSLSLEQAGRSRDTGAISVGTPGFIAELRGVIDKIEAANKNTNANEEKNKINKKNEDTEYLREKLIAIKEACGKYDVAAAKNLMAELKEKEWTIQTENILEAISDYLLHSKFRQASAAIDDALKST